MIQGGVRDVFFAKKCESTLNHKWMLLPVDYRKRVKEEEATLRYSCIMGLEKTHLLGLGAASLQPCAVGRRQHSPLLLACCSLAPHRMERCQPANRLLLPEARPLAGSSGGSRIEKSRSILRLLGRLDIYNLAGYAGSAKARLAHKAASHSASRQSAPLAGSLLYRC